MTILDWLVDNKKTIEDIGDKAKKYAKEEMKKDVMIDRMGKILGFKRGGKVKKAKKPKTKKPKTKRKTKAKK